MALECSRDMTVYLVEDSPAVRDRILGELRSLPQIEVAGVASGAAEALTGIQHTKPHLVVLDLNLSEGTGLDVLRGLNADAGGPLVYMVSNNADETTRSACRRAGASRFFDKTTEMDRFFQAVQSLASVLYQTA